MNKEKESFKDRVKKKWTDKYRLVIVNEETFEEKVSFKLSRLNVFVTGGFFSIILVSLTILLIAFTPLKEYIPGYTSTAIRRNIAGLIEKTDSLQQTLSRNEAYQENIRKLLAGEIAEESVSDFQEEKVINSDALDLAPSSADSSFRASIEADDRYNIFQNTNTASSLTFRAPLEGLITGKFDPVKKHYAIDIACSENTPVMAAASGTVVFSAWTADAGYVTVLNHLHDKVTIYKHNSSVLKEVGDKVESGEVIAMSGNGGELSTGPHLHFEIWVNGYPVDPLNFVDFKDQ